MENLFAFIKLYPITPLYGLKSEKIQKINEKQSGKIIFLEGGTGLFVVKKCTLFFTYLTHCYSICF